MKAILMTATGEVEVLQLSEVEKPVPGPNDLLVRVAAASVNPLDTKIRRNHLFYPGNFPAVLGCDGAGNVAAVGSQVTRFRPGDAIYFFSQGLGKEPGAYAEFTVVHEDHAASRPATLSMTQAGAVPLVLVTAWEALIDRAGLQKGERVLIHAGAGGVGHLAIQLARNAGARIATTARGSEKAGFVRSLGAEEVIDYTKEDFVERTIAWSGGHGADLVLDTVGGETFVKSLNAVRPYGRVATLFSTVCDLPVIASARRRNLSIFYQQSTGPMLLGDHAQRCRQTAILDAASSQFDSGLLQIKIGRVMPLADAASAHRVVEEGRVCGKVVLEVCNSRP